jgi:hypothetical protein
VLKALVAQQASDHANKYHDRYKARDFIVADRRVLLTHWVAEAWIGLYKKYQAVIIKTFRSVGLSLNPDGSEDAELSDDHHMIAYLCGGVVALRSHTLW